MENKSSHKIGPPGRKRAESRNQMDLDLNALQAEVGKLSDEEVRAQLLALKTKQKVQTKKYSNSEGAKKYRVKQQEVNKLLAARAKELGIYDEVMAAATEAADAKLGAEAADLEDDNANA